MEFEKLLRVRTLVMVVLPTAWFQKEHFFMRACNILKDTSDPNQTSAIVVIVLCRIIHRIPDSVK